VLLQHDVIGAAAVARFAEQGVVLNEFGVQGLGDRLEQIAQASAPPVLYLDLGNVLCLTAAGLGLLLRLHRRLLAQGGRLVLCRPGHRVREVLEVTKLGGILDIRPGEPAVYQEARRPAGNRHSGRVKGWLLCLAAGVILALLVTVVVLAFLAALLPLLASQAWGEQVP
jgi:anti-anti-sigma factor